MSCSASRRRGITRYRRSLQTCAPMNLYVITGVRITCLRNVCVVLSQLPLKCGWHGMRTALPAGQLEQQQSCENLLLMLRYHLESQLPKRPERLPAFLLCIWDVSSSYLYRNTQHCRDFTHLLPANTGAIPYTGTRLFPFTPFPIKHWSVNQPRTFQHWIKQKQNARVRLYKPHI